jgi:tRNA dimethylallyltransferase
MGMDVGTGKITETEKRSILHHMIDIIPPSEIYSVGQFKKDCNKVLTSLFKK